MRKELRGWRVTLPWDIDWSITLPLDVVILGSQTESKEERKPSWKMAFPGPQSWVELCCLWPLSKRLYSSFSRMPDPDFTVRDVKLLVGKLLAV